MILPFLVNRLYRVKLWSTDSSQPASVDTTYEYTDSLDEANIISSEQYQRKMVFSEGYGVTGSEAVHTPVLDIDVPAQLVQSSTPGRHHLYIDAPMTWDTYVKLLDAMQEAGILEPGYVSASKERGFTAVRLPWIRKFVTLDQLVPPTNE